MCACVYVCVCAALEQKIKSATKRLLKCTLTHGHKWKTSQHHPSVSDSETACVLEHACEHLCASTCKQNLNLGDDEQYLSAIDLLSDSKRLTYSPVRSSLAPQSQEYILLR